MLFEVDFSKASEMSTERKLDDLQRKLKDLTPKQSRSGHNLLSLSPGSFKDSRVLTPWTKSASYFRDKYVTVDDNDNELGRETLSHDDVPYTEYQRALQSIEWLQNKVLEVTAAYALIEEKFLLANRVSERSDLLLQRERRLNGELESKCKQLQHSTESLETKLRGRERTIQEVQSNIATLENENLALEEQLFAALVSKQRPSNDDSVRMSVALDKAVADIDLLREERDKYKDMYIREQSAKQDIQSKIDQLRKKYDKLKDANSSLEAKFRSQSDLLADMNSRYQDAILSLNNLEISVLQRAKSAVGDDQSAELAKLQGLCVEQQAQLVSQSKLLEVKESQSKVLEAQLRHDASTSKGCGQVATVDLASVKELTNLVEQSQQQLREEREKHQDAVKSFLVQISDSEALMIAARKEYDAKIAQVSESTAAIVRKYDDLLQKHNATSAGHDSAQSSYQLQVAQLEEEVQIAKEEVLAAATSKTMLLGRVRDVIQQVISTSNAIIEISKQLSSKLSMNESHSQHSHSNSFLGQPLRNGINASISEDLQKLFVQVDAMLEIDRTVTTELALRAHKSESIVAPVSDPTAVAQANELQRCKATIRQLEEALNLHFNQLCASLKERNADRAEYSEKLSLLESELFEMKSRNMSLQAEVIKLSEANNASTKEHERAQRALLLQVKDGQAALSAAITDRQALRDSVAKLEATLATVPKVDLGDQAKKQLVTINALSDALCRREDELKAAQAMLASMGHASVAFGSVTSPNVPGVAAIVMPNLVPKSNPMENALQHITSFSPMASVTPSRLRSEGESAFTVPLIVTPRAVSNEVVVTASAFISTPDSIVTQSKADDEEMVSISAASGGPLPVESAIRVLQYQRLARSPTLTSEPETLLRANSNDFVDTPNRQGSMPPRSPSLPPRPGYHHHATEHITSNSRSSSPCRRSQSMPLGLTAVSVLQAQDDVDSANLTCKDPQQQEQQRVEFSPVDEVSILSNDSSNTAEVGARKPPASEVDDKVIAEGESYSFGDCYEFEEEIGKGTFGTVYKAIRKLPSDVNSSIVAVKVVYRSKLPPGDEDLIRKENHIMCLLNRDGSHQNVIKFYDFYEDASAFFMVLELIQGGELFDRLVKKVYYSEKEARDLVHVLLGAVKHCHDRNVVHRDLKPENLLLVSEVDDRQIKLIDFGVSDIAEGLDLDGFVGSIGYIAPELYAFELHGKPVDMWAIGVITYLLLAGIFPFDDIESPSKHKRKVKSGKFTFPDQYFGRVSAQAKDLIGGLLCKDVSQRLTVDQALRHDWFQVESRSLSGNQLQRSFTELRRFNARRKFKAVLRLVLAKARFEKRLRSTRQCIVSPTAQESTSSLGGQVLFHETYQSASFSDRYTVLELLKDGKFGRIHHGIVIETETPVLITITDKQITSKSILEAIKNEYLILASLPRHVHIVQGLDFYDDECSFFNVTESIRGENVFDRFAGKRFYSEDVVRNIIKVLLEVIQHCVEHHVIHRNLSPENIIFNSPHDDGAIKVTDFKEARFVGPAGVAHGYCGTVGFNAPECLRMENQSCAADMWSVGAISYFLLSGCFPYGNRLTNYLQTISTAPVNLDRCILSDASNEAVRFVEELLVADSRQRIAVVQAAAHSWMLVSSSDLKHRELCAAVNKFRVLKMKRSFRSIAPLIIKKASVIKLAQSAVCREHVMTIAKSATYSPISRNKPEYRSRTKSAN